MPEALVAGVAEQIFGAVGIGAQLPGRRARALAALFGDHRVAISNISGAKYYGRVLADVTTAGGQAVAPILLDENLVRPYAGGRREPWCD